ncbi:MAG: sel1 repeat family protein, partial [Magnetococcales bacterium]|nr:sel1 repeat family protein [Magnetococcales bacterium]
MLKLLLVVFSFLFIGASDHTLDEALRLFRSQEDLVQQKGLSLLEDLANAGVTEAEYVYGLILTKGIRVRTDPAKGIKYFQSAAEKGHADAMYYLGAAYRKGDVLPKDDQLYLKWIRQSAIAGSSASQGLLGSILLSGELVPRNSQEALYWYRKSAMQGNEQSRFDLAYYLSSGDFGERDPSFSVQEMEALAQGKGSNSEWAKLTLATWYAEGTNGLPEDPQHAIELLLPLTEKNNLAVSLLAIIYARPPLIWDAANQEKARYWLSRLGDDLGRSGLLAMGLLSLVSGREDPAEELRQARHWWGRITDRQDVMAIKVSFANSCYKGEVPCRESSAQAMLLDAAMENFPEAQQLLGDLAMLGRRGAVSGLQMVHWYRQSAPHLTEAHRMAGPLSRGLMDEAFALLPAEPWNQQSKGEESFLPALPEREELLKKAEG